MPERTIIARNAMIVGYEQNGLAKEAIELFYRMREAGVAPDSATLVSLLYACSHLGHLSLGQSVQLDLQVGKPLAFAVSAISSSSAGADEDLPSSLCFRMQSSGAGQGEELRDEGLAAMEPKHHHVGVEFLERADSLACF